MAGSDGDGTPDADVVARSRTLLYVIAVAAGIAGLVFLVWLSTMLGSYWALAQADATTAGTITETRIEEHTTRDDWSYTVSITYRYQVNGRNYTSSNVYPGDYERTYNSRGFAEAFLDRYSQGSETTVHYDPRNPENAHLVDEPPARDRMIVAFAVALALFGGSYLTANRARHLG